MPPEVTFIAEVGLRVNDLPLMTRFYQDVMGFEVQFKEPTHVFMIIAPLPSPLGRVGHPQILALFDRNLTPNIPLSTMDHLAFEIPQEDYDLELANFQKKGMVLRERVWPDTLPWRGRSFFFKDPEGNVIELITALEAREI